MTSRVGRLGRSVARLGRSVARLGRPTQSSGSAWAHWVGLGPLSLGWAHWVGLGPGPVSVGPSRVGGPKGPTDSQSLLFPEFLKLTCSFSNQTLTQLYFKKKKLLLALTLMKLAFFLKVS